MVQDLEGRRRFIAAALASPLALLSGQREASAETDEQRAKEQLSDKLWQRVEENRDQPLDAIVASFRDALKHDPLYDTLGLKEKGPYETLEAIARGLGPFVFFEADYDPAAPPGQQYGVPFVCGAIERERIERNEDGTCLRLYTLNTLKDVKNTPPFRGLTFTYPKSPDGGEPTYLIVVNRDECEELVRRRQEQLDAYHGSPRDGASGSIAEPGTLSAYYLAIIDYVYKGPTYDRSVEIEVEDSLAHERLHVKESKARARNGRPLRRSPEEREREEAVIGAELLWGAETTGDAARALLAPIELVLGPHPGYARTLLHSLGEAAQTVSPGAAMEVSHGDGRLLVPDVCAMRPDEINEVGRRVHGLYTGGINGPKASPGRSR